MTTVGAGNPLVANHRKPVAADPHFMSLFLLWLHRYGVPPSKSFSTLKMGYEVALKQPEAPAFRVSHIPVGAELRRARHQWETQAHYYGHKSWRWGLGFGCFLDFFVLFCFRKKQEL